MTFLASSSCRDGLSWRRDSNSLRIFANAVAREFTKVNETRLNGAAKVEGKKIPGGTLEEFANGLNVGSRMTHPVHHEKNTATLSTWIAALATAVLAVEKQRRISDAAMAHKLVALDTLRRGKLVENDLVYRQTFVIRSYEAGFDKIASIETIANLFQVSNSLPCFTRQGDLDFGNPQDQ